MLPSILDQYTPFTPCDETEEYLRITSRPFVGKGEKHHILPVCLFPEHIKEHWNIINLSYQQHYRCHELLPYMLGDKQSRYKLLCAWNQMCGRTRGEFIDADRYAHLKAEFSRNNPSKDPEVKRKKREKQVKYWLNPENISQASGENNHRYGVRHTHEAKKKISLVRQGVPSPLKGRERPNLKGKLAGAKNPRAKPIEVDGVRYETYTQAAKKHDVTIQAIIYWVKTGRAIDLTSGTVIDWVDSRNKLVYIKGINFERINNAAEYFKVSRTTITNWIKKGLGKYI